MQPEFKGFPKLSRLSRNCVISEKLDGTNACVIITENYEVYAQSRTRLITPEDDNFGFAKWVKENEEDLKTLGPGHHFGEWLGSKIQRTYGLKEKRFYLFNTARWSSERDFEKYPSPRPVCCHVVPVIYSGIFTTQMVEDALTNLRVYGSRAVPGFMDVEGVVVYHEASGVMFKKTLKDDGVPKSKIKE